MSIGAVAEYEVLRAFSGGPNGTYQPGERIAIENIRPENAASLAERRYLRPVGIDFDANEERAAWRARLAPFAAITSIEMAPQASKLGQLAARAADLERVAIEREARAAALHAQLQAAQAVVDGATEASDFAEVSRAMAETEVVGRLHAVAAAEAQLARAMADEEARQRDGALASVRGSCAWLQARIEDEDASLGMTSQAARWGRSWIALSGWLGALEPTAEAA